MANHPNRAKRVTLVNCFSGAILGVELTKRQAYARAAEITHESDLSAVKKDIDAAFRDDDGEALHALLYT